MIWAVLGILIHIVAVWIVLEFVEQRWPTLHRVIKASIIAAVVGFLIALLRGWLCGWLCR